MLSFQNLLIAAGADLLLLGAGGHGRVVADTALAAGWGAVSATDRDVQRCQGHLIEGVDLVATDMLAKSAYLHVCIGDNSARKRESLALADHRLASVVHPAAVVSAHAVVGPGCFIAAGAIVAPGAQLGRGVIVNHGAVVDHDAYVGEFAHIAPGACVGGGASLGAGVLIGTSAVVLPGVHVTAGSTLGAGAVAVRSIDSAGTYVGAPARRIA